MAHNELDLEQPLDSKTWETINEFSLWLHAQHELADIQRGSLERIKNIIPHRISMFDLVTMEEDGQKTHWVKRVIGLPGDTVTCVNDVVFINGKVLDKTQYIDPDYRQSCVDKFGYFNKVPNEDNTDVKDFDEVKLDNDEYYVMGDNRPYSKDSRYVGPVKKSQLFAKNMLVLLPFSDMGVKD